MTTTKPTEQPQQTVKPRRKKPRRQCLSTLSTDPLSEFLTDPMFTVQERAIYMVIRSYANTNNEARLQQATIGEAVRYSPRYVRTVLASLKAKQALRWERKQYFNHYILLK